MLYISQYTYGKSFTIFDMLYYFFWIKGIVLEYPGKWPDVWTFSPEYPDMEPEYPGKWSDFWTFSLEYPDFPN